MARKKTTEDVGGFVPIEVSVPTLTTPIATSEVTLTDTPSGAVAVAPAKES